MTREELQQRLESLHAEFEKGAGETARIATARIAVARNAATYRRRVPCTGGIVGGKDS